MTEGHSIWPCSVARNAILYWVSEDLDFSLESFASAAVFYKLGVIRRKYICLAARGACSAWTGAPGLCPKYIRKDDFCGVGGELVLQQQLPV